jgi:plasmid stabilization system protein ParE
MGLPGEDLTSLIGSHIVIYRVSRNKVRILRICHQCMNLAKHV